MSTNVLITGGAGFIGSNLANYLLDEGYSVIIYDNFERRGSKANVEWLSRQYGNENLKIIEGDIRDFDSLRKAVGKADIVYHLAAQVAVTSSIEDPRKDFQVNAQGGLNVLEAVRHRVDIPVVYVSTNKVYGSLSQLDLREESTRYVLEDYPNGIPEGIPIDLYSPYGCSKGTADLYFLDYARIYNLKTVVFRQSCVYGPRQFGNEDQGWVAHFVISTVLDRPITIYGDGKQVRDLLHVSDAIKAYIQSVDSIDLARGQAYNLGGGPENTLSLLELIDYLERRYNKPINPYFDEWRLGDQRVYVSDVTKSLQHLNWAPQVSVDEGLEDLCNWVDMNKELLKV